VYIINLLHFTQSCVYNIIRINYSVMKACNIFISSTEGQQIGQLHRVAKMLLCHCLEQTSLLPVFAMMSVERLVGCVAQW